MQCVHARLLWSESSGKGGRVCDPNHNAPAVCLLREGGLHASVDAVEAKCFSLVLALNSTTNDDSSQSSIHCP